MPVESPETTLQAPVPVDLDRLPGIRPLAAGYATHVSALAPFFNGDPGDDAAWAAIVAARRRAPGTELPIAAVLRDQQAARNAPAAAREATARLATPEGVAVVTGQQAGLFGGPLYTLLKAVSAIRLARQVERTHGVPAVPVFWVDAEDHDLDEIRTCGVLDSETQYAALSLPVPPTAAGTPACAVALGPDTDTVVEALAATLPATDFTAELVADLRQAYTAGRGLVEAFASWMERLLGSHGLVVFDSSDPAAKPLVKDLFEREIRTAGTTTALARETGQALERAGFHAQVDPVPGSLALFVLEGTRDAVRQDGEQLRVGDRSMDVETLLTRLEEDASRFGPNVLLRPVVQDRLFPTVCYVAGPNELAYLAQLKPVYAHFDIPMPLVAQRLSATLVDAAVVKFLRRYDVSLDSLQPRDEAALNRLLATQLPPTVDETMEAASGALREQMARVSEAITVVDPTLSGAADSTLGRMERDLRNLQNKVVQAAKRRDQTLRRQFVRAQSQMFPQGVAQERTVGLVYFLNKYGPALIDRLVDDTDLDADHHWLITI